MKKVDLLVVTTNRADYGLLYPLYQSLLKDEHFKASLVVTGAHLSDKHGRTVDLIKADGIKVSHTVEMTMVESNENAICNSIAIGLTGFSSILEIYEYDAMIVLGDRYELWAACPAAVIHKIPIVHIHGGEATFGNTDDAIRHSCTKMSSYHFVTHDIYEKRIIQMGEHPDRVFNVGALGLDNIRNTELFSRKDLSARTEIDFSGDYALLTYHPVTLDCISDAKKQIETVMNKVVL